MAEQTEVVARFKVQPGPMTAEEAVEWTNAQIPYANLAGNEEIAARALAYAREVVTRWDEKMVTLRAVWERIKFMLRGNSLNRGLVSDDHVPELYKKFEQMVPRIEEALLDEDPWFRAKGRDRDDRERAESLAALLDWQLDQAGWRDTVQASIRDMLIHQVSAIKVRWDRQLMDRVQMSVESEMDKKGQQWRKIVRRKTEEVIFEGPRLDLVDHVDAMTLEESEHQMATRLYQNTAKVHFNQHQAGRTRFGRRIVYGGVIISTLRALSFNGLANERPDLHRFSA